jgi:hypothetical protein
MMCNFSYFLFGVVLRKRAQLPSIGLVFFFFAFYQNKLKILINKSKHKIFKTIFFFYLCVKLKYFFKQKARTTESKKFCQINILFSFLFFYAILGDRVVNLESLTLF